MNEPDMAGMTITAYSRSKGEDVGGRRLAVVPMLASVFALLSLACGATVPTKSPAQISFA